jgi:hypothetical protein
MLSCACIAGKMQNYKHGSTWKEGQTWVSSGEKNLARDAMESLPKVEGQGESVARDSSPYMGHCHWS